MSVIRILLGKRFSICPNGASRTCAIVQVSSPVFTKYILEVARPDDWSISTLILQPMKDPILRETEKKINVLLYGLVQKGGHWDNAFLKLIDYIKIEKVKHYRCDTAISWLNRVNERLSSNLL
ncbi:hypothetical protein D3C76_1354410 [compost metagenome]